MALTPDEPKALPILPTRIVPYTSFAGVEFGADERAVVAVLGTPKRRQTNRHGATELHYGANGLHYPDLIVRLTSPDGVFEFSAAPPTIRIGDEAVGRHDLAAFLFANDLRAVEEVGFVRSPRFGLMIDVEHDDHWVTALPRSEAEYLARPVARYDPGTAARHEETRRQAEAAWGGKGRACPKCGTVFRSVADRGGCPKCGHVFLASNPGAEHLDPM